MAHFTSDFDWVCCKLYGLTRDRLSDHLLSMLLSPLSFYLVRYHSMPLQAELCTQVFFSNGKKLSFGVFSLVIIRQLTVIYKKETGKNKY